MTRKRNLRLRAGYTMVEVMMALAVFATGATGLVAMQKAALIGNTRARNLATASMIAATWLDRLKLDALGWRKLVTGNSSLATDTKWLNNVGNAFPTPTGNANTWIVPAIDPIRGYSPAADSRGNDIVDPGQTKYAAFCTHINVLQLMPNMIRTEVRVFWLRNLGTNVSYGAGSGTVNGMELCANNAGYVAAVSDPLNVPRYHFVYMADAVMQNGSNL